MPEAKTALIVGAEADAAEVLRLAGAVDRALFYSFATAFEIEAELGYRGEVIDISSQLRELDAEASAWSAEFSERLSAEAPWIQDELLAIMRRRLHVDLFWPIAVARARAQLVSYTLGPECNIQAVGVTDVERSALNSSPDVIVPSSKPRVGLAARLNLVGASLREWIHIRRERAALRRGIARNAARPLVVALAAVPIHVRLVAPAIRELKKRGWDCAILQVYPYSDLTAEVAELDVAHIDLARFLPHRPAFAEGLSASRDHAAIVSAARGWTMSRRLRAHESAMVDATLAAVQSTTRFARAYEAVLGTLRPAAVLTLSELYPGIEPIIIASRRQGVPAIHVQHGNIPRIARMSAFPYDAFCVFGEAYAETLQALGTDRERIRVTGSPYLDTSALPDGLESVLPLATQDAPNQSTGRFTILFIAGYLTGFSSHALLYETLSMVLDYADAHPDVRLIVKLHPAACSGISVAGYDAALAEHPGASVEVVVNGNTFELIRDADCVVTRGSTVAVEAALFRKPVILLNALGSHTHIPLDEEGTALVASSSAAFAEQVTRLRGRTVIPDAAFELVRERYFNGADGLAGVRIADVCEELGLPNGPRRG